MADRSDTTIPPAEEWRPVEGWPYEVSSLGRVRRAQGGQGTRAGRFIGFHARGTIYRRVILFSGKRPGTQFFVHRLVCKAFHGAAPTPEHDVAHWDGNGQNNAASNVRWVTRSENALDGYRLGPRSARQEWRPPPKRPNINKLTREAVREIRGLLARGLTKKEIGDRFGVSRTMIRHIATGENWAGVL